MEASLRDKLGYCLYRTPVQMGETRHSVVATGGGAVVRVAGSAERGGVARRRLETRARGPAQSAVTRQWSQWSSGHLIQLDILI